MVQHPDESLHLYIHTLKYTMQHKKTAREHRSFKFQASIRNAAVSDKISSSKHFPWNLQEYIEETLTLEAGYQLSEGIILACIANVMSIQNEDGHLNDIRSGDVRANLMLV